MTIFENININIDMAILENIDIDIDIDKGILQNIDIVKISYRLGFGISNTPSGPRGESFSILILPQYQDITSNDICTISLQYQHTTENIITMKNQYHHNTSTTPAHH